MKNLILILTLLGLCACNGFVNIPSDALLRTPLTQPQSSQSDPITPQITQTPQPSPTPSPIQKEKTIPPLPTKPAVNIATIIADPEPDFNNAFIYSFAHLANGQLLVTIEVPGAAGDLQDNYKLIIEDEELKCIVLDEYPSRLYCHGPTAFAGKIVTLHLFHAPSHREVFAVQAGIPPSPYLSAQTVRPGGKAGDHGGKPEPSPTEPPVNPPTPPHPYP